MLNMAENNEERQGNNGTMWKKDETGQLRCQTENSAKVDWLSHVLVMKTFGHRPISRHNRVACAHSFLKSIVTSGGDPEPFHSVKHHAE